MPRPEQRDLAAGPDRAGWRLHRMEMQNWGTYHQRIHRLTPEGGWSLLVGQNASGKSTAIDALRTLLVPPRLLRQSYNDAAGESKSMDRTRYSYVRGVWRTQSSEASTKGRPDYLRDESQHSTLLAVFHHREKQAWVTLAQLLWLAGDRVEDMFLVATEQRSIKAHLSLLGSGTAAEWKKVLRDRQWEVKGEFSAYSNRFRSLLGIPSEGALEVFNQAIGVKDVEDIDDFVRKHMLEPSDARSFINDTLQPHYKELKDCHEAIRRAEDQIAKLIPIAAAHTRKEAATARRKEVQELLEAAPLYYASQRLQLLEDESASLDAELKAAREEKGKIQVRMRALEEKIQNLDASILRSDCGQELQRLANEIANLTKQHLQAEKNRQPYLRHLHFVGLSIPGNEEEFHTTLGKIGERVTAVASERETVAAELAMAQTAHGKHLGDQNRIEAELKIARERRVAIPLPHLQMRDSLCDDTGIPASEIPFAGELVEVNPAYREWTGAIERVLHALGVSLLLPETHYQTAVRWINGRHLGFRLVFHRIPPRLHNLGETGLRPERVAARLKYRHEHPLHEWTKQEISRRFQHVCCDDINQLSHADAGVTREGLVKESGTRHVKDDRFRVDDPSKWVLGWSAERKITALISDLSACMQQIKRAADQVLELATQNTKLGRVLDSLNALLLHDDFDTIDSDGIAKQLTSASNEKRRLEESDGEVKEFKRQLDEAKQSLGELKLDSDILTKREGGVEAKQEVNGKDVVRQRAILEVHPDFEGTTFAAGLAPLQGALILTLEDVDDIATEVSRKLRGQYTTQSGIIGAADREMLPLMAEFLAQFGEHRSVLKADVSFASEFADLRSHLEKDDLPRHRLRFEKLMDENLVGGMAHFQTHLLEHEKGVRERIGQVNTSLKGIPYTAGTHVQIIAAPTSNKEIGEFRSRLRSCLEGGLSPSAEQRPVILERIRLLMDDFQKRDDWVRRVTDARQWMEFNVRQLDDASLAEVDTFGGSGGRSGGQRAKLAFTILASAIVSQYGLAEAADPSECFRLVVIDEVFGQTDEEYSRQALELFFNLGLQLIVVNPFDAKARLVEDWVETIHLAANPERKDSRISRMSRAEYEELRREYPEMLEP